ncbi:MAG: rhomboid family intramembrane serine protease [Planctomycetia bacterium]|nr:rhomboid family intramembrane serine protease [Planctomycetia bacterium]
MIIIPINTDAPIYHWPWMTLVLIVANCACFYATGFGAEPEGWVLQFGHGLHPVEWVTYNFFHFGWLHLIGNMIFLWGFGIIVEGKIGWWRYLLVYLLIGVLGGVLIQTAMLRHGNPLSLGGGGASLVIFGLLAMCVVWAPRNELELLIFAPTFMSFRVITYEVTILTYGFWYVAMQVLSVWWNKFSMGGTAGHLIGAVWGFGIALMMLKLHWIDCENWDLLAVRNGTYGKPVGFRDWGDEIRVTHKPGTHGEEEAPVPTKVPKKQKAFRPSIYISEKPNQSKRKAKTDDDFGKPLGD